MNILSAPHQNRLERARYRFVDGGDLPADLLPVSVARSWMRSRDSGLMPWQPRLTGLGGDELAGLSESDRFLARCATPEIDRLWHLLGGERWTLFCVNTGGVIVHERKTLTPSNILNPLQVGRRIREIDIGTTAPSCTLADDHPVVLLGNQHYLSEFERFFCVSVPLHDAHGELIGALDITGIGDRQASIALELLEYAALAIQSRYYHRLEDCRVLSLQHDPRLLDTPGQALLAINEGGRITAANPIARRILDLSDNFLDRPLDGLFEEKDSRQLLDLEDDRPPALMTLLDGSRLYVRNARATPHPTSVPASPAPRPAPTASPLGQDDTLNHHFEMASKAFAGGVPILLEGETGTGKEVFARALHDGWNSRSPFVAINCAAIPESLIEAELFGYADGTFTGGRKGGAPGRLEAAHGGTLLLDEIGDMPPSLQTRLLRVLQERRLTRLGSSETQPLDVRVVSATHCDLSKLLGEKQFRDDLYFRLNGLRIQLPPLRQRRDKQALIQSLLVRFGDYRAHEETLACLMAYQWPGNIRELEQTLRLATILAGDQTEILPAHLPPDFPRGTRPQTLSPLQEAQRRTIEAALRGNRGNIAKTARELGLSRTTLYKKLKRSE